MNRALPGTSRLSISSSAYTTMLAQAWEAWPLETGGIIMGLQEGPAQRVVHVIGAGPGSKHSPTSFSPDAAYQAEQVAALWRTDRRLLYLGDWHTHPRGSVTLSRTDVRAGLTIAASPEARQPQPCMLVLSLSDCGTNRAAVWQLRRGKFRPVPVQIEQADTPAL